MLGKKIKTVLLTSSETIAPADLGWVTGADSHTFQDDVRVIGFQLGMLMKVPDAATNADHEVEVLLELSKHGSPGRDGAMGRACYGHAWNAVLEVSGGGAPGTSPMCFPDGHGMDYDDGEAIYMHAFVASIGTVNVTADCWAIIYYVER